MTGFAFSLFRRPSRKSHAGTTPSVPFSDECIIWAMLAGTAIFVTLYVICGTIYVQVSETARALYIDFLPFTVHKAALLHLDLMADLPAFGRRLPPHAPDIFYSVPMALLKLDARLFADAVLTPRGAHADMLEAFPDVAGIIRDLRGRGRGRRRGVGGRRTDTAEVLAARWESLASALNRMHRDYLYCSRIHGAWRAARKPQDVRFTVDGDGEWWVLPEWSLAAAIWRHYREAVAALQASNNEAAGVFRHLLETDLERRRFVMKVWRECGPLPAFDN